MTSTSEYADLKAAVRTQKEQAAAIATAVRDAEERVALAELEVVRAQEETQREKSAREKAEAELTALHRQHRQHRRMAARSTEDVRAEADASAAERIAEAAAAHASELATLRAAARACPVCRQPIREWADVGRHVASQPTHVQPRRPLPQGPTATDAEAQRQGHGRVGMAARILGHRQR